MSEQETTNKPNYKGHPILTGEKGEFNCYKPILNKLDSTFNDMTERHNKVMFMRMDVRFPKDSDYPEDNKLFSKFITTWNRNLRRNGMDSRTVWVRERSREKHQHYHCVALMDGNKTQSIVPHVEKAERLWGNTLGISKENAKGLINTCPRSREGEEQRNGVILRRDDPSYKEKFDDCFRWSSYLAKQNTKGKPGDGVRDFGGAERRSPKKKSS